VLITKYIVQPILKAKTVLRMRRSTCPGGRGLETTTYLKSPTPICLFTIRLLRVSSDDLGQFTYEPPHYKAFLAENCPAKKGSKNSCFGSLGGEIFLSSG